MGFAHVRLHWCPACGRWWKWWGRHECLPLVRCQHCHAKKDLWLVNAAGDNRLPELWVCVACLRGPWSDMVPQLLEAYPDDRAEQLRAELRGP